MSALVVAGLVASGSAAHSSNPSTAPTAPEALLAANQTTADATAESDPSEIVGLLPVTQEAPRKLRALSPSANTLAPFAGTVPLQSISLPPGSGTLGIPEIVLAAYRNAELAMQTAQPGCGLTWNLLAGIGRIESGHASSGRTDAAGTTTTPIFGPALDGTLPGNEIIKEADGGYVRAVGPMQFLPSTWAHYSADGNGDGAADPHNVFDAALGAAKYLCSGGLDLRDSAQELRAVLRYNNSMSYAANVLSWSAAYRTGGAPSQVTISPDIIPPGSAPTVAPNVLAADAPVTAAPPSTTNQLPPDTPKVTTPTQVMITLPGLPPIPCGIFCPAPVAPEVCVDEPLPAQMPNPVAPAPQTFGAEAQPDPAQQNSAPRDPAVAPGERNQQAACAPAEQPAPAPVETPAPAPEKTPEPGIAPTEEPAPPAAPAPTPQPGITLPFNIVIPLPPAPPAP
ncbi:membrane-bound lytic murein transglycosylase B [Nocardia caishijiensis]|uniref:Membrane-bound lytic murein transglycosylase B n=2 Tax=Nocardia caishijiensis TaxID=184756 RepID=A0ABQ6YK38_9NOCA|nr:membrane-bound lytic murein transglycosylase B [Nocardia caishijiensis]